jgi:hypothetical protein
MQSLCRDPGAGSCLPASVLGVALIDAALDDLAVGAPLSPEAEAPALGQ